MWSMRMRLPSRSAQIWPTSKSAAVAFLTVALLLGAWVWLGISIGCRVDRHGITMHDTSMRNRVVFAIFAAAMLFSMTREWCAPIGCPRVVVHSRAAPSGARGRREFTALSDGFGAPYLLL